MPQSSTCAALARTWVTADGEIQSSSPAFRWGYPRHVHTTGGSITGPGLTEQITLVPNNIVVNPNSWAFLNWGGGLCVDPGSPIVLHTNDASSGDSGSSHLKFISDVGWLVVSIQSIGNPGGLADRRWDWTVLNFVATNSPY